MNIRLKFIDFWNTFDSNDNVFTWSLRQKHNVMIDNINPNLIITQSLTRSNPNIFTIYYNFYILYTHTVYTCTCMHK
jgi:hypothetical protein